MPARPYKKKELAEAHYWAERAANLAPDQEEPWLILASSSNPPDVFFYLKKALDLNPASQKARKGMHWAIKCFRKRIPSGNGREPLSDHSNNGSNNLYERWNQITSHWILLLIIAFVAGIIGWGASYIKSEEYEANATALIRSQRVFGATGEGATQFNAAEAEILSQAIVSFFRSRPVAEKVVQTLHLDEEKPITDPFKRFRHDVREFLGQAKDFALHGYVRKADPYEAAIESYRENIVAAPIFQSNLLIIQVKANDPDIAAAIANQSAETFFQYANTMYGIETGERRAYLDQQLESAKSNMEHARLDLLKFQQANHITNLEEEINARLHIMLELENELNTTKGDIASLTIQLNEIKVQLDGKSSTLETRQEGSSNSSESGSLSSNSRNSESGVTNSSSSDERSINSDQTTVITETNPLYLKLREEQLQMERTIPDLEERQSLLDTAITQQRKYVEDLSIIYSSWKQLDQEFLLASSFYNNLRVEQEQAVLDEAFPIDEVRLIDVATPPLYPKRPIRILYAVVGAVIGLFGGILLVILRETWLQRKTAPLFVFEKVGTSA